MKFVLSLRSGGLMEDPNWHYDDIQTIEANSLKEAKDKYAKNRGYIGMSDWNPDKQTLWGWEIVDMNKEFNI